MNTQPLIAIPALPRDLRVASETLGKLEARFLVDTYYQIQDFRKSTRNQERSMEEEPHATIAFFGDQMMALENQIKNALDRYSNADSLGMWSRKTIGVGPIISAGLLAHIDIERAPTVGHIWRFGGYDPTQKWEKGKKRPWNADLKVLFWKLGESFAKVSGNEKSLYGRLYRERKEYELARDARGGHAETAAQTLQERNIRDKATRKVYEEGKLPAGRLDRRARRYATKLFLSHWHEAAYRIVLNEQPPKPFAIAHMDHIHYIEPEVPFGA